MGRIRLLATAEVTYDCELTEEETQKVVEYAEENDLTIEEATIDLWERSEIDIYSGESIDVGCSTEDIDNIEFEEDF